VVLAAGFLTSGPMQRSGNGNRRDSCQQRADGRRPGIPSEDRSCRRVGARSTSGVLKPKATVLCGSDLRSLGVKVNGACPAVVYSLDYKRRVEQQRQTSISLRYNAIEALAQAMIDRDRTRRRTSSRGPATHQLDRGEVEGFSPSRSSSLERQYSFEDAVPPHGDGEGAGAAGDCSRSSITVEQDPVARELGEARADTDGVARPLAAGGAAPYPALPVAATAAESPAEGGSPHAEGSGIRARHAVAEGSARAARHLARWLLQVSASFGCGCCELGTGCAPARDGIGPWRRGDSSRTSSVI